MARDLLCVFIGFVFLIALAVWVIRDGNQNAAHKRRKLARRFCADCGYDVHAGTGNCPECGAPIPPLPPSNPQS